jgi:hypothetical protein
MVEYTLTTRFWQALLSAGVFESTNVQGQPNDILFQMSSNVAVPGSSVISINLAAKDKNDADFAACLNSSAYRPTIMVKLQKSNSMPLEIVAKSTVEITGESIAVLGSTSALRTEACKQPNTRIDFVLPDTQGLLPNEVLNFTIRMINSVRAGNEMFVNLTVQGCRASMFMLGWSDDIATGAPATEFRALCPWNSLDCGPCNIAPRRMWASATGADGNLATILSSRVAPTVVASSVLEEGPVTW